MKRVILIFLSLFVGNAYANIVLSDVIIDFIEARALRKDITISNVGKQKLYVSVRPYQVLNPGSDKITRKEITDPRMASLIVTPNKLILGPGERRALRFLVKKRPTEQDDIFRVKIVPQLGKIKLKAKEDKGKKRVGVKVLVGYDALVISRPIAPRVKYKILRKGKSLNIENTGNTNFLVEELVQCDDFSIQKNCSRQKGPRVYAGKKIKLNLERADKVQLVLRIQKQNKIEMY